MKKNDNASLALVAGAIGVLIIIAAGFLLYYNISGQTSNLPAAKTTASTMNNTTNLILGTIAPIAAIVLIAGAAIVAVTGFGKR